MKIDISSNIKRVINPKKTNEIIKGWFWNKEKDCWDYIKDPQYDLNVRMKVYYILYFAACCYSTYEHDKEKNQAYLNVVNYIMGKESLMRENFKYNNMDGILRIINNDKHMKTALKYGQKWAKSDHNDFPY